MPPALELKTTQTRLPVRIDGASYEMRTIYDLGLTEIQAAERLIAEIAALLERDRRTKAQETVLEEKLRLIFKTALAAPPKVQRSLNLINLLTLYRAFAASFADDIGVLLAQATPAPSVAPPSAIRRKR